MPEEGKHMEAGVQKGLIRTSCLMCSLGCGMDVYLEDGRISKVLGMKEHPLNRGVLCPKGEAALEYLYSPDRLKYPLIKRNGNWHRISWDEALDIIADKLTKITETEGARSFATAIGMSVLLSGSITPALIRR